MTAYLLYHVICGVLMSFSYLDGDHFRTSNSEVFFYKRFLPGLVVTKMEFTLSVFWPIAKVINFYLSMRCYTLGVACYETSIE